MCLIIATPLQVYIKLIVSLLLASLLLYVFWNFSFKNLTEDTSSRYQTITNNIQCNTNLNDNQLQVTCTHHGNILEQTYEAHSEALTTRVRREVDMRNERPTEDDANKQDKHEKHNETNEIKVERTRESLYPKVDTWIITALQQDTGHKEQTKDGEIQEDAHNKHVNENSKTRGEMKTTKKPDFVTDFEKKYFKYKTRETTKAGEKTLGNDFIDNKDFEVEIWNEEKHTNEGLTQPRLNYFQNNAPTSDPSKEKSLLGYNTDSILSKNQIHTESVQEENYYKERLRQINKDNFMDEVSNNIEKNNIQEDLEKSLILEYLTSGKIRLGKLLIQNRRENRLKSEFYENDRTRSLGDLDIIYDDNIKDNTNEIVNHVSNGFLPNHEKFLMKTSTNFAKRNETETKRFKIVEPTTAYKNTSEILQNKIKNVTKMNDTAVKIAENKIKDNEVKYAIEKLNIEQKGKEKKKDNNKVSRQAMKNGMFPNFQTDSSELYKWLQPTNFNFETDMYRDLPWKNNDDILQKTKSARFDDTASHKMNLIPEVPNDKMGHKSNKRYYGINNVEELSEHKPNAPNENIEALINFLDNEDNFLKINQEFINKPMPMVHDGPIFATKPILNMDRRDNVNNVYSPISHSKDEIDLKHNLNDAYNGYNSFLYNRNRHKAQISSKNKVEPDTTTRTKTPMLTKVEPTIVTKPNTFMLTKPNVETTHTFAPLKTKYIVEKDFNPLEQNDNQSRKIQQTNPKYYVYNDTFSENDLLSVYDDNKINDSIKQITTTATTPEIEETATTTLRIPDPHQKADDSNKSLKAEIEELIEEQISSSPTTEVTTPSVTTTTLPFDSNFQSFYAKSTSTETDLIEHNQTNCEEQYQDSTKYTDINESTTSTMKPTPPTYYYYTFRLSRPPPKKFPGYVKKDLKIIKYLEQISPRLYTNDSKMPDTTKITLPLEVKLQHFDTKSTPLKSDLNQSSQEAIKSREVKTIIGAKTIRPSTYSPTAITSKPITSKPFNKYQKNIKMTETTYLQKSPISTRPNKISIQNEKDIIWRRLIKQRLLNNGKYKVPFLDNQSISTPVKSNLIKNLDFLQKATAANITKSSQSDLGENISTTHIPDMNKKNLEKSTTTTV
ncbi:hypothetical protein WDU94_015449 [Cyamophila willieti]